jgi:hypothetical protein
MESVKSTKGYVKRNLTHRKRAAALATGPYNSCLPRFFGGDDRIGAKRNPPEF